MKLSEVLTHFTHNPISLWGAMYLLIDKLNKPHITIINSHVDTYHYHGDNCEEFLTFKSDKVNIEYIGYYLILNMKRLIIGDNKVVKYKDGYELDHLTVDFIYNIDVTLPDLETQNKCMTVLRPEYIKLYTLRKLKCDTFNRNKKIFSEFENNATREKCNMANLCKIKNIDLFFSRILKGNLDDPTEYLEVSDKVNAEYLVYYVYYGDFLYNIYKYNDMEISKRSAFCLNRIYVDLIPIKDQNRIVDVFKSYHDFILDVINIKRETKTFLRELISINS